MNGRGTRLFLFSIIIGLAVSATGFSLPAEAGAPGIFRPALDVNRLCQDQPAGDVDYAKYFSSPEREGAIIHVFYNNVIDAATDSTQFGYALIYGLEAAAESAKADDTLAVGIYFTNGKGKIYLIRKSVYDNLSRKNLPVDKLIDSLMVKEVITGTRKTVGTPKNN
jgi:hypothetical protein